VAICFQGKELRNPYLPLMPPVPARLF
jgi:hypothetical protein